ncbi:MAG: hypothetical protein ACKOUR_16540 [Planctomycetota bacterium]
MSQSDVRHRYASRSLDHAGSRRAFFGAAGVGLAGLGLLHSPLLAEHLISTQKRVLMIF